MTREEAITNLKMISVAFVEPVTEEQRKLIDDTFDMAIQALEQEPKTGHWIGIDEEPHEDYECDKCGFIHTFIDGHTAQYNYCPNCGARMVEEQESEE